MKRINECNDCQFDGYCQNQDMTMHNVVLKILIKKEGNNMSIRDQKEKIIKDIMNLRTTIGELSTTENEEKVSKAQRELNGIQDKVFNI